VLVPLELRLKGAHGLFFEVRDLPPRVAAAAGPETAEAGKRS